jgi:hypothetical protein
VPQEGKRPVPADGLLAIMYYPLAVEDWLLGRDGAVDGSGCLLIGFLEYIVAESWIFGDGRIQECFGL